MGGRETAIAAARSRLAGRKLIWFGIRGEDGEALGCLPELAGSFCISAPMPDRPNVCLEALRGSRPDLDRYDIDFDSSDAACEFRREMLREAADPCVVLTYRPSAAVSALGFVMAQTATIAGPFNGRGALFDHKPWVETSLSARGVSCPRWRYVADHDRSEARRMARSGTHVLRASHTSGGVGVALARREEDVDRLWPARSDALVAIAPFLDGVPLNLSGCVFPNGDVRLHPISVQLIGIGSCTSRELGYCGNDFGAPACVLDEATLQQVDALGRAVGGWLHEERYAGAFGIDALATGRGDVVFLEVNARFQGSSAVSAEIAEALDEPDLHLDHLTACLGLPPSGPGLSIPQWAARQPALSRIVIHNRSDVAVGPLEEELSWQPAGAARASLVSREVAVEPGGVLCAATVKRSVTRTGFEIDADAEVLVDSVSKAFGAASADTRLAVRR